jgi:hypothetical protein
MSRFRPRLSRRNRLRSRSRSPLGCRFRSLLGLPREAVPLGCAGCRFAACALRRGALACRRTRYGTRASVARLAANGFRASCCGLRCCLEGGDSAGFCSRRGWPGFSYRRTICRTILCPANWTRSLPRSRPCSVRALRRSPARGSWAACAAAAGRGREIAGGTPAELPGHVEHGRMAHGGV